MIEGIEKKYPALFLIRHGHTDYNNEEDRSKDLIKGWKDIPLNEEGKKTSKALSNKLMDIPFKSIYCSDLLRSHDTAKEIAYATNSNLLVMRGLRPWNLGDFQGTSSPMVCDFLRDYIKGYIYKPVKGGESFYNFKVRVIDAFNSILDEFELFKKNMAIVTHYRVIKIIQSWVSAGSVEYEIDTNVFMKDDIKLGNIITITLD